MLFDLQSPGRRRVIKVVYAMLAILLAVGLVGFGIGSDATGGISEIFGGGTADTGFEDEIEDAEKKAAETPKDSRAQLEVAVLYIQQGNQQLDADEATGQTILTPESEESFGKAADAWASYLKLKPPKPDTGTAIQLAGTHFVLAQNSSSLADAIVELENAVDAQRVAAEADPSVGNLGNLAYYLYLSGQIPEADRVAAQAVAKTPKDEQAQARKEFEAIKKQGEAIQKQAAQEKKQGAATQGESPLGGAGGALGGGSSLGGP